MLVYNFWESSIVLYKVCQNKNRLKNVFGFFRRAKTSVNKQRINATPLRLKFRSEYFGNVPKKVQFLIKFSVKFRFWGCGQAHANKESALPAWKSIQAANITKQNISLCTFLFILELLNCYLIGERKDHTYSRYPAGKRAENVCNLQCFATEVLVPENPWKPNIPRKIKRQ